MTEKLTLKKLSGELETLRKQVQGLEQQLEHKLETTLEKVVARLESRIGLTSLPEHGTSIDAEHRQRLIAEEAYLIAERRGFQGGDSGQDWARAEQQVNHRLMQEGALGESTMRTKRPATNKASTKKAGTKPSSRAK